MHSGNVRSAQEALAFYGTQRCADGKGVTIPSQIRYVGYYERFLKGILSDGPSTRMLHRLIVSGIPQVLSANSVRQNLACEYGGGCFQNVHIV